MNINVLKSFTIIEVTLHDGLEYLCDILLSMSFLILCFDAKVEFWYSVLAFNSCAVSFCSDFLQVSPFRNYLLVFVPFSLFQTSLMRILIFSDQGRVNWTDESPKWWPSGVTFSNPTGRHDFTSQQCDKVIHAFIKANVAYLESHSSDLIDDTFEEEAFRFESDIVSVLIFVMAIRLWLTMECHKNLEIICTPYLEM